MEVDLKKKTEANFHQRSTERLRIIDAWYVHMIQFAAFVIEKKNVDDLSMFNFGSFVTKLAHSLRVEVLREKKENFRFVVFLLRRQRDGESKKSGFICL